MSLFKILIYTNLEETVYNLYWFRVQDFHDLDFSEINEFVWILKLAKPFLKSLD